MQVLVDHVVLAVADLEVATRVVRKILGREAVAGGRHEESGTTNAFVPLENSALELVMVTDSDQAAMHPFGRLVARCVDAETLFAGWVVDADAADAGVPGSGGFDGPEAALTRGDSRFLLRGIDETGASADRPFAVRRIAGEAASAPSMGRLHAVHVAIPDDAPSWPAVPVGSTEFTVANSSAVRGAILNIDVDDADGQPVRLDAHGWKTAWHAVADESERLARMKADRRSLHRIPEVGLDLPLTQEYVAAELERIGLTVTRGRALSSVTALLEGGGAEPGIRRAVVLRSDMDALALQEATGLEFASDNGAMHACGHDLHMAMLLEAARTLANRKAELAGDVLFVFQPGEENHGGARLMLDEGLYDSGDREISASFGMHVLSYLLPSSALALRRGPIMAGSSIVEVTFAGKGGHGSAPHRARDPLAAGASFVPAVTAALAHAIDMFEPNVLTFGSFHSGSSTNVIPDEAVLQGTLRSFSAETTVRARAVIERVAHATAAAHDVAATVELTEICLPVVNDDREIDTLVQAAGDAAIEVTWLERPISVSEDFSYMLEANRGAFALLGAVAPGRDPGSADANHSAQADFDEAVMPVGADLFTSWAIRRLAER